TSTVLKSVGLRSKVVFVIYYLTSLNCAQQWNPFLNLLCPNTIGYRYMSQNIHTKVKPTSQKFLS
ncbi:MAG: hypothetical protein RM021_006810, partial [Nostoc sp. EkiNYC01]